MMDELTGRFHFCTKVILITILISKANHFHSKINSSFVLLWPSLRLLDLGPIESAYHLYCCIKLHIQIMMVTLFFRVDD